MERVKTDDNNMRAEGYLLDTQRFTPPRHNAEIGFGEG